ncbi:MAG TPA: DegV family protein [Acidimicrobiales bacterium]|nr:DegV family protein [Acidimicrobiales bacterium]
MTVRVVTDSACDLPDPLAAELGIEIVPLTIRFGVEELVDRRDFTPAEFWARSHASPVLPQTAAPSPGAYEERYRGLAADGATGIVVVALSGALSATLQSAQVAAAAVAEEIPVAVVDSRSVTLGIGMVAVAAARHATAGGSLDEVAATARDLATRTHVVGTLDTLENLKKGGRIGGAKALLASVLAIKPVIEVRDGWVAEGGRQRTRAKAFAFLVETVRQAEPIEALAVAHGDASDVGRFLDMLRPLYAGDIVVGQIGAVIGAHTGPGTIGVIYQTVGAN